MANMGTMDTKGKAVQIVKCQDDKLSLNRSALESILMDESVINKQVAPVAVSGLFRRGKSFILNFMLRFMEHNGNVDTWLQDVEQSMTGFGSGDGARPVTTGIWMWNKPIPMTLHDGTQVVVLLIDTQGTFDQQTSMKTSATVFGLSALISSHLVYNVSNNISSNDWTNLDYFLEYGSLVKDNSSSTRKPFQSILFLVRDWQFKSSHDYGYVKDFNRSLCIVSEPIIDEVEVNRSMVRQCCEQTECFLMPNPGSGVVGNDKFRGQIKDIDQIFLENLKPLMVGLLDPKNVHAKEIDGVKVNCQELCGYFVDLMKAFDSPDLPTPATLVAATTEASNRAAARSALHEYVKHFPQNEGNIGPSPEEFLKVHEAAKLAAINHFKQIKKMGTQEDSERYIRELMQDMEARKDQLLPLIEELAAASEQRKADQDKQTALEAQLDYLDKQANAMKLAETQYAHEREEQAKQIADLHKESELIKKKLWKNSVELWQRQLNENGKQIKMLAVHGTTYWEPLLRLLVSGLLARSAVSSDSRNCLT